MRWRRLLLLLILRGRTRARVRAHPDVDCVAFSTRFSRVRARARAFFGNTSCCRLKRPFCAWRPHQRALHALALPAGRRRRRRPFLGGGGGPPRPREAVTRARYALVGQTEAARARHCRHQLLVFVLPPHFSPSSFLLGTPLAITLRSHIQHTTDDISNLKRTPAACGCVCANRGCACACVFIELLAVLLLLWFLYFEAAAPRLRAARGGGRVLGW